MVSRFEQKVAYKDVPLIGLALATALGAATYGGEYAGKGAEYLAGRWKDHVSNPEQIVRMTEEENAKCKLVVGETNLRTGVSIIETKCSNSDLNAGYTAPLAPGLKQGSQVAITRDQRYVQEEVTRRYNEQNRQADGFVSATHKFTVASKEAQIWAPVAAGAGLAFPFIFAGVAVGMDLSGRGMRLVSGSMARRREDEYSVAPK